MLLCLLALACTAPPQEPARPQGVTIRESRDMAAAFTDVQLFLADENYRAANGTLQRILESEPQLLVRSGLAPLFQGAAYQARQWVEELPQAALEVREEMFGDDARQALQRALDPPDPAALQRLLAVYSGTQAAAQAARVLRDVQLDRGYPQRAAAGASLEEVLPREWIEAMPAPLPSTPVLVPSPSSFDDPRLPRVRPSGAHLRWQYSFEDPPFERSYSMFRAAIGGGLAYLTDAREVVALNLATGETRWRYEGPDGWSAMRPENRARLKEAFQPDYLLVPVLGEGVLLATVQEPVLLGRHDTFRQITVRRHLPGRRLYAFDAENGEILWKQKVAWLDGGDEQPRGLVAGPPAIAAGRVFVPVYDAVGTLRVHILALDLHTGEELWRTFLVSGQRETNLFGNVLKELAAGPPAADAERVLVCTNLGTVSALDAATGQVIWTRLYERTDVTPFQTGDMGRRIPTFANGPPGFDGERFVCAPTDSEEALAMEAATGELIQKFEAQHGRYGDLRNLLAILPGGALFNGTRLAFLPFEPSGEGRGWSSNELYKPFVPWPAHRSGVLARDGVLVPTNEGVLRFKPESVLDSEMVVSWSASSTGALQAAPGMLLVTNAKGVQAYTSPDALVETVLEMGNQTDSDRLAETLPFLEGLRLDSDRASALRLARVAADISEKALNQELEERFRLVAAQAFLDALTHAEAAKVVEPLLQSANAERRVAAAVVLLDALERRDPGSELLRNAVATLEATAPSTVRRQDGREEPLEYALGRARYLAAAAVGEPDRERRALLDLVRLPEDDRVLEDGQSLGDWAVDRLRDLARAHPDQARTLDREAERMFREEQVTESLLRAYAGTETADSWLREQAARTDASRAEQVRYARWLRDYLGPGTGADRPDTETLFGSYAPGRLPRRIELLHALDTGDDQLLAVGARDDHAYLLLLREGFLILHEVGPSADREVARHSVREADLTFIRPENHALASESGFTLVEDDLWIRIGFDGSFEAVQLPGEAEQAPLRLGKMAVILCKVLPDTQRLQIRDLETGALFFDVRLPGRSSATVQVVGSPEGLAVLEPGRRLATYLRPLVSAHKQEIALPWAPHYEDIQKAVACGAGVLLPSSSQSSLFLIHDGPPVARMDQPTDRRILPFSSPRGAGWILDPLTVSGSAIAAWLPAGQVDARMTELDDYSSAPQLEGRQHRASLDDTQLLLTSRGTDRSTRFHAVELEPAGGGGPKLLWTRELEEVPNNQMIRNQPVPLRGSNGWFLPVRVYLGTHPDAQLLCFLLDDEGRVVDEFGCPAGPGRASSIWTTQVDDNVLLRAGEHVYLLGER